MTTIGVDLRVFNTGRISGVEEYTRMLLAHMVPLDTTIRYRFLIVNRTGAIPDEDWLVAPHVKVHALTRSSRFMNISMRLSGRPQIDQLVGNPDVFFFPHFIFGTLSSRCPRVLTFHDLSYERFPEFLPLRRRLWHRLQMRPRWQAGHADRLIAVSSSTARDLRTLYGIASERISVVHSGVDPSLQCLSDDQVAAFRRDRGLPERFILSLCTAEPRKNLVGLVRAFERLASGPAGKGVHLVIAGEHGWLGSALDWAVTHSPYRCRIRLVGPVSSSERAYWYAAASVFAYPSFFEGFGFPPLEAMACGTPVVTGHHSSLPEVVGDAGLLVDSYDLDAIAAGLAAVLTDRDLHALLSRRGIERARRFSWNHAAEQTLEILVRAGMRNHPHTHADHDAVY